MSIRDYKTSYVVINGTTNEQIKVPRALINSTVTNIEKIDDVMLFDVIMSELAESDSVTVFKSYMKD